MEWNSGVNLGVELMFKRQPWSNLKTYSSSPYTVLQIVVIIFVVF